MITELSILLPCYNNACLGLVAGLSAQAESIIKGGGRLSYEIIVADDGSTDAAAIAENMKINDLPRCRYIVRGFNSGRSAIRNFLAREARHPWLLFIDSDMRLGNDGYIAGYLKAGVAGVAYGGYVVGGGAALKHNLRYNYERKYHKNASAAERRKHPYDDFHTSNFIARRSVMLAHPLDERFRKYGYEDVLFGKELRRSGIMIEHVDNPLLFADFETNADFTAKTEEGLATLNHFACELRGYSSLVDIRNKLGKLGLIPLMRLLHTVLARPVKNNITGNKPSILLFNIYKLLTFCKMENEK